MSFSLLNVVEIDSSDRLSEVCFTALIWFFIAHIYAIYTSTACLIWPLQLSSDTLNILPKV